MKGKSAEKSPQDEVAPSKMGGGNAAELNQKITDQGNKVTQLKGQKVPKVCNFRRLWVNGSSSSSICLECSVVCHTQHSVIGLLAFADSPFGKLGVGCWEYPYEVVRGGGSI